MKNRLLIALLFCLPIAAFARPDSLNYKDYTYKTLKDTSLQLSVFMPHNPAKGKTPVMILFHGGGFTAGNRGQMYRICNYFANRGIVTISASYRLLKKTSAKIPGNLEVCLMDAKNAIRWVKSNASRFNIDTNRVILGGGSAGGYLSTMSQFDNTINSPGEKLTSSKGNVFVMFNPAYPVDEYPQVEPFGHEGPDSPPSIFFFGTKDPWRKNGKLLYDALKKNNVKAELWNAPNQGHAFFNQPAWCDACCAHADDFLVSLHYLAPNNHPAGEPAGAKMVIEP